MWLKSIDGGFEPSSCDRCRFDPQEKDELIGGQVQCESSKKFCKYWNNLTKAVREREGFEGNPMNFLEAGGLEKFEVLSSKLAQLSSLDGERLQTFDFYSNLAGTSDLEEEEFQSLLALKLSYIRRRQIDERIKASRVQ
jgi:hypothetical protein